MNLKTACREPKVDVFIQFWVSVFIHISINAKCACTPAMLMNQVFAIIYRLLTLEIFAPVLSANYPMLICPCVRAPLSQESERILAADYTSFVLLLWHDSYCSQKACTFRVQLMMKTNKKTK